jgi:ATP-dependent RNA helicase DeaD
MGAGRAGGIRPGDLVGAITNEAGITGDQIGAIDIADRFAVVELPEALVDRVIQAMRKTRINGRKVPVRRFVEN